MQRTRELAAGLAWAALLLGTVAGCGGDGSGPGGSVAGTAALVFAGVRNGSYSVTGDPAADGSGGLVRDAWATATFPPLQGDTAGLAQVVVHRPTSPTTADVVRIDLMPGFASGSETIIACGNPANCSAVYLAFDDNPDAANYYDVAEHYYLAAGTITLTARDSTRIVGTFSGTAVGTSYGVAQNDTLVITAGTFSTPPARSSTTGGVAAIANRFSGP